MLLVTAFLNDQDYNLLGSQLGIHQKTVRNIIYRYRKTEDISVGRRGGNRPIMITESSGEKLLDYLEDFPEATLSEMKTFLKENTGIDCSLPTISRFLSGKFFTIKKVRHVVDQRNSDRVNELRSVYVLRLLHET